MIKYVKYVWTALILVGTLNMLAAQEGTANSPTLKLGDPAPSVKVMKWAKEKGEEVYRFKPDQAVELEQGKVYVLEFWATWCIPCRVGMPHLSELARHYSGQVTVLGISIRENIQGRNPEYAAKVQAFVDQKSAVMDYNVGIDGADDAMDNLWMRPSGLQGVPNAIVVTKEGKIGWMGHPLNGMQEALDLAIAGELNEKTGAELMNVNAANDKKWRELLPLASRALSAKDFAAAKNALDEMDRTVQGYFPWTVVNRYRLLTHTDPAAARELAEEHYKTNYMSEDAISQIASEIMNSKDMENPDYEMALKVYLRLKELHTSPNEHTLEMLAKGYALTGNFKSAVIYQQQVIDIIEDKGNEANINKAKELLKTYENSI